MKNELTAEKGNQYRLIGFWMESGRCGHDAVRYWWFFSRFLNSNSKYNTHLLLFITEIKTDEYYKKQNALMLPNCRNIVTYEVDKETQSIYYEDLTGIENTSLSPSWYDQGKYNTKSVRKFAKARNCSSKQVLDFRKFISPLYVLCMTLFANNFKALLVLTMLY